MNERPKKTAINPEVAHVGERIKQIIKEKGLKTREVAHDAEMDVENLRKHIRGVQEMKITTMLKIVKALGITPNNLFDFK